MMLIYVVMPMHNLLEYSNIYLKTSITLWQYYRDQPTLNNNIVFIDFPADDNSSNLFKFKQKITWIQTNSNDINDVKVMVPLKYLSNFWRTFEIPLINCEISLMLS